MRFPSLDGGPDAPISGHSHRWSLRPGGLAHSAVDAAQASRSPFACNAARNAVDAEVLDWLLDPDPSIRWQVLRDIVGEAHLTSRPNDLVCATDGLVRRSSRCSRRMGRRPHPENPGWQASPEGTAFTALLWLKELGFGPGESRGA